MKNSKRSLGSKIYKKINATICNFSVTKHSEWVLLNKTLLLVNDFSVAVIKLFSYQSILLFLSLIIP